MFVHGYGIYLSTKGGDVLWAKTVAVAEALVVTVVVRMVLVAKAAGKAARQVAAPDREESN